jgi:hypothetical protein
MRLRYRFTFIDVEIEDHQGRSAERRVKFPSVLTSRRFFHFVSDYLRSQHEVNF